LVLIAASILVSNDHQTKAFILAPVLGTALILLFGGQKGDPASTFLSSKAVVGIGLISYSLYVWHQPIFAVYRLLAGEALSVQGYRGEHSPGVSIMARATFPELRNRFGRLPTHASSRGFTPPTPPMT
jgi:peptidoglycan/LPS O-acetylase OafA/YrhL